MRSFTVVPIFLLDLVPGGIYRGKAVVRVHLRAGHSQSAQNLGQDELFQFDLPCDASVSQSGGPVPWKCRTLVRRIGKTASTLVAYERTWRMNVENGFLLFGSKWDFLSLKDRVADPIHNFVTCSIMFLYTVHMKGLVQCRSAVVFGSQLPVFHGEPCSLQYLQSDIPVPSQLFMRWWLIDLYRTGLIPSAASLHDPCDDKHQFTAQFHGIFKYFQVD